MREGTSPDPKHCPLCGGNNQCSMVAGGELADCWCAARSFPQSLLQRAEVQASPGACICSACTDSAQETEHAG